jgi:hypothetical protein
MGKSKWDNYSNEELIDLIKEKYLNGELKSGRNLGTKTNTPDLSVLQRRFNIKTWNDFLFLCNLKEKLLTKEERIECSINELKELAEKLNRCPMGIEYDEYKKKGYIMLSLEKNINMNYSQICEKYLSEYTYVFPAVKK